MRKVNIASAAVAALAPGFAGNGLDPSGGERKAWINNGSAANAIRRMQSTIRNRMAPLNDLNAPQATSRNPRERSSILTSRRPVRQERIQSGRASSAGQAGARNVTAENPAGELVTSR